MAAGCERIHLHWKESYARPLIRIVYQGLPPRVFSLDAILKGLAEPLSLAHGCPEAYLTEGILASQAPPTWLRVSRHGREVLRQNGPEVECWRSADGGPERAELELSTELPGSAVRARCGFSPVPVWLGGEPVKPRFEAFLLGVQRWGGGPLPAPEHVPRVRVGSEGPLDGAELYLEQTVGEGPWDSVMGVPMTLDGPSTIDWVRDGVIVASETHDLGRPATRIVAAANGLTLDMTRFRVIPGAVHAARLEELKQRRDSLLEALAAHRDLLHVPDRSFEDAAEVLSAVLAGGVAAVGIAALTCPPLAWLGAGLLVPGAGWLAYQRTRTRTDVEATERVKRTLWPPNRSSPP